MNKKRCRDVVTWIVFVCPVVPAHCHPYTLHGTAAGEPLDCYPTVGTVARIEADTYADTEAEFALVPAVVLPWDNSPEGSPSADHSSTAG